MILHLYFWDLEISLRRPRRRLMGNEAGAGNNSQQVRFISSEVTATFTTAPPQVYADPQEDKAMTDDVNTAPPMTPINQQATNDGTTAAPATPKEKIDPNTTVDVRVPINPEFMQGHHLEPTDQPHIHRVVKDDDAGTSEEGDQKQLESGSEPAA